MIQNRNKTPLHRAAATTLLLGIILTGVYLAGRGYPLGDRVYLRSDSLHQYMPFMAELRRKLLGGESLLYSFGGGLGFNFWAAIGYYMASPLNVILLLFPQSLIPEAITAISFLKISLAGGVMTWYLESEDQNRDFLSVAFGCAYGLSAYFTGYYFNMMWLDSILVLPLIMAGICRLLYRRDGRLYCAALCFGLFCNYYIGYMLCLFSCIFFAAEFGKNYHRGEWKKWLRRAGAFAAWSVLAAGMAAVMLVPSYCALRLTKATNFTNMGWTKFYANWLDMLARCFSSTKAVYFSSESSDFNLYCGNIMLILAGAYFLDGERSRRERLVNGGVLLLLWVSINNKAMVILWNGLHLPNGFPGRFTWLYMAWVVVLAYQGVRNIGRLSRLRLAAAIGIPLCVFAAFCLFRLKDSEIGKYVLVPILLIAFGVLLWELKTAEGQTKKRMLSALLCGLMLAESIGYAFSALEVTGKGVKRSVYCGDLENAQSLLEAMPEGFYRADLDKQTISNGDLYLGLNGLTLFSSTLQENLNTFFEKIGINSRLNKVHYIGVTGPISDLLGVRFLLSEAKEETLYQMERVNTAEKLNLFESKTALSLGIRMPSDIRQWEIPDDASYIQVQSSFLQAASGQEIEFTLREIVEMESETQYRIDLLPDTQTYLEIPHKLERLKISAPQYEKTYKNYTSGIYNLGQIVGGSGQVTVETKYAAGKIPVPVWVYDCTDESAETVNRALAEKQMEKVQVSGNHISGIVRADEGEVLFLSVPYDSGWKVKLDGRNAESFPIANAFLGVELTAGAHIVEMTFVPEGLIPGGVLSVICVGIYIFICRKMKKTGVHQETEHE